MNDASLTYQSSLISNSNLKASYWDNLAVKTISSDLCTYPISSSNWNDVGVTLNEEYIKDACRKIWEEKHTPKLLDGPEIPKWTGFIEI